MFVENSQGRHQQEVQPSVDFSKRETGRVVNGVGLAANSLAVDGLFVKGQDRCRQRRFLLVKSTDLARIASLGWRWGGRHRETRRTLAQRVTFSAVAPRQT